MIERSEKIPTVSVVIPTYNRAHLVGRAIQSVLNQTYQDFEIIVVDDGSTDNTEEVVKSFNDPRIRYIRHDQNRGGSAARNTGIKMARGEYIAFQDSDDEWLPIHLDRKIKLMKCTKADGLIGSYIAVSNGRYSEKQCKPLNTLPMAEYILSGVGDAQTSTMIFRRVAIAQVLFDETLPKHQDWDLAIRFEQDFELMIDSMATVILHRDLGDRMSLHLNHSATRRFLERHQANLSRETKAHFCFLLAFRTFASEGRTGHYREWVKEARAANPHALALKTLLAVFSIPVLDGLAVFFLNGYFRYRKCKASKKLPDRWESLDSFVYRKE